VDFSVYDRMRLWRLENSFHSKGQRYKIPLTYAELTSLDFEAIKEKAREQRSLTFTRTAKPIEKLKDAYDDTLRRIEKKVKELDSKRRDRERTIPDKFEMSRVYHCIKRLIQEGIPEASYGREPTANKIASSLRFI
jgi:hypothetical protein